MKKFLFPITVVLVILGSALFVVVKSQPAVSDKSNPEQILIDAISKNPNFVQNYFDLSFLYLQKVRETANITYYQKINNLMDKVEKVDPNNGDIYYLRGNVEVGRHHFLEGKNLAKKAIEKNSNNYLYYGLLGDSEIELGEYTQAVDAFQKMVNLRPGYAAYVRIAYIRELNGDIVGAKKFLKLAIESGSSFKENVAFANVELGKLDMRTNLENAKTDFENALSILPDYPPAIEGLGKVAYFQNDKSTAKEYFQKAYDKLSIAQYATNLADLNFENDSVKVQQYLSLAQITYSNSIKSGVNTDLEESLFLSDHNLDLPTSLIKAQNAYKERPSIYASDYYAWALYKNNKLNENKDLFLRLKKESFALGENDPLILFHQGIIAKNLGDKISAKKYLLKSQQINPYFSILDVGILNDALKNI